MKKIFNLNKHFHFFLFIGILIWLKNLFAYFFDFKLKIENIFEYFILIINPIPITFLILSLILYIKKNKLFYNLTIIIYLLINILLFSNIIYYREFTDFLTINTILGVDKIINGLGNSTLQLFRTYDFFYIIDIIYIFYLLIKKKINFKIKKKQIKKKQILLINIIFIVFFFINIFLAEIIRPQLLKRQFSRDYIVKLLGINTFTIYDTYNTIQTNKIKKKVNENDIKIIKNFLNKFNNLKPNKNFFGIAKNKNIIYIHLESFQQFLIDFKLKDKNNIEHTVTPFINKLYHDKQTFSFENFFHQVGQGKTSDAEILFEASLFGLNKGSLFTQLGEKNIFHSAPLILKKELNYNSAVFHGNSGNFWNRNKTYKNLGYDFFFDSKYYNLNKKNSTQYGLHDKPFFKQSIKYFEHIQQPFYTKFIAVSNHYPYSKFINKEAGFPIANTNDNTINGYFATANYLDKAVEEFFNYLKKTNIYKNSIIILYGDHYGISNSRNKTLSELIPNKNKNNWNLIDDIKMQKVPYIIHIPGQTNGYINKTYCGQIDTLPTLLHLLGINTKKYILLGQDIFSKKNEENQIVIFRNGNIITPKYIIINSNIYSTKNEEIINDSSPIFIKEINLIKKIANKQLQFSDQINNGNLLNFYFQDELRNIKNNNIIYKNQFKKLKFIEKNKQLKSNSIYNKNNNITTITNYYTNNYQYYNKK